MRTVRSTLVWLVGIPLPIILLVTRLSSHPAVIPQCTVIDTVGLHARVEKGDVIGIKFV